VDVRVPLSWLRELVDVPTSADELAERLTMVGIEVAAVRRVTAAAQGPVVAATIMSAVPHPSNPQWRICRVSAGSRGEFQVVTAATNLAVGDRVPLALPGTRLGPDWTIRREEFGGEPSEGMLCSATELIFGIPHLEGEGILQLPHKCPPGTDVVEWFGWSEDVLELDLTPNLAHCFSLLGVAREVAALFGGKVRHPAVARVRDLPAARTEVILEDPEGCPAYVASEMEAVRPVASPPWLMWRLRTVGLRCHNVVVDITNYTMWELGVPLHPFDADRLGDVIRVRRARAGEELLTLDGEVRKLNEEILVIADGSRPVALAGVMGGKDTEVTSQTRRVLLESAYFNPFVVGRGARRLGLWTEAASRFAKGVDPSAQYTAALRAIELLEREKAAVLVSRPRLVGRLAQPHKRLLIRPARVAQLLGIELGKEEVAAALRRQGFQVAEESQERLAVTVPSQRVDLNEEVDLVEEVARVHGYDRIPAHRPVGALVGAFRPEATRLKERVADLLVAAGLQEVVTTSFMPLDVLEALGLPEGHEWWQYVRVMNPGNEGQRALRTSLIPVMARVLTHNVARQQRGVHVFEIGTVFRPAAEDPDALPEERVSVGLLSWGPIGPRRWCQPRINSNFYYLKGVLEELFGRLGVGVRVTRVDHPLYAPGRGAQLLVGEIPIGHVGEWKPEAAQRLGLRGTVATAEVDWGVILAKRRVLERVASPARFPAVFRDLALLVPREVSAAAVAEVLQRAGGEYLEEVELFDLYEGPQVEAGWRSLAFGLRFRAPDRTLTEEEVSDIVERMLVSVRERTGARLRT